MARLSIVVFLLLALRALALPPPRQSYSGMRSSSSAYDDAEYDDDDSGIQVMITNKMRRALEDDLGYLADEVDSMEPSIAAVVIERRLIRPSNGMPLSWQRPPAARGGGRGGGVLGRARLALSRLKTKMEESVGLFVSITLIALSAGAAHQLISSGGKLPGLPWLRQVISSMGGKVGGLVSCVFSLGVGVAKSAKTAAAAAASAGLSGLSARTGVGRGGGEGRRDFPSPSRSAADTSAASGSKSSRQLQLQLQLKAKANAEAKAKAKAKAEAIKQEDKGNAKTKAKSKEERKKFVFEPKSKTKTKAMTASKAPTTTGGTTQSSRSSSFPPLSLAPRWAKRGLGGGDNGGSGSTTSSVSGNVAGMRGERERLTERFSDDETETERRKRGGGFRFGWGWGKGRGRGRGGEQDKDKDKDISAKHKLFTRPPAALPKPSSKANTARAPSRGQTEGSSGSRGSSGSTSSSVSTSGSGSSDYPRIPFGSSSSSSAGSSSGSSGSSSSGAGIKSTVGSVDLASMHDITRISPLEAIRLWFTTNKMNRAVGGKGGAGAGAGAGGFDDHSSSAGTKRR